MYTLQPSEYRKLFKPGKFLKKTQEEFDRDVHDPTRVSLRPGEVVVPKDRQPKEIVYTKTGGVDLPTQSASSSPVKKLHPCLAAFGSCKFNDTCKYAKFPLEACLFHLQGQSGGKPCNHGDKCFKKHYSINWTQKPSIASFQHVKSGISIETGFNGREAEDESEKEDDCSKCDGKWKRGHFFSLHGSQNHQHLRVLNGQDYYQEPTTCLKCQGAWLCPTCQYIKKVEDNKLSDEEDGFDIEYKRCDDCYRHDIKDREHEEYFKNVKQARELYRKFVESGGTPVVINTRSGRTTAPSGKVAKQFFTSGFGKEEKKPEIKKQPRKQPKVFFTDSFKPNQQVPMENAVSTEKKPQMEQGQPQTTNKPIRNDETAIMEELMRGFGIMN